MDYFIAIVTTLVLVLALASPLLIGLWLWNRWPSIKALYHHEVRRIQADASLRRVRTAESRRAKRVRTHQRRASLARRRYARRNGLTNA